MIPLTATLARALMRAYTFILIRGAAPLDYPSDVEIYDALKEANGNLSLVAQAFKVRRHWLATRIDMIPDLKVLLSEVRETVIDVAEQNIYADVMKGDSLASRFVLETIGKDRGFVRKIESDQKAPVTVNIRRLGDGAEPSPEEGGAASAIAGPVGQTDSQRDAGPGGEEARYIGQESPASGSHEALEP